MATPKQKAFWNACGVAILQHGLPWRRRPETLSRVNYKQTLRVFPTIVVYRVIVVSLVTSLKTYESVTFFLNCSVFPNQNSVSTHFLTVRLKSGQLKLND
jgi:hypothetical protein